MSMYLFISYNVELLALTRAKSSTLQPNKQVLVQTFIRQFRVVKMLIFWQLNCQNLRVQKVMSQTSAGSCTRCTRSNAFPAMYKSSLIFSTNNNPPTRKFKNTNFYEKNDDVLTFTVSIFPLSCSLFRSPRAFTIFSNLVNFRNSNTYFLKSEI